MRAKRLVALLLILTLCFGAAGGTVSATLGEVLNGTQESTAPTTEDGTDPQQDDATEPVAETQQTLSAGHRRQHRHRDQYRNGNHRQQEQHRHDRHQEQRSQHGGQQPLCAAPGTARREHPVPRHDHHRVVQAQRRVEEKRPAHR